MGLLDNLGNLSPEQTQGLLAAASQLLQAGGPSRMPTSFGQALGGGLAAFQGGMDAATQRKLQLEQARQASQLHGLQIQGLTGELQDKDISRKQNLDAQEFLRNYNTGAASPTRFAQSVLGTDLAPTVDNAARLSEARMQSQPSGGGNDSTEQLFNSRIAQAAAMRATGNPLLVSQADALEKQALSFRPEFDQTPRFANGLDGKPFAYVLDKSGNKKDLPGVLPRDERKLVDLGGRQVAYDPFAIQPGQTYNKTMTPGEIASNGIARERLTFDKSQAALPQFNTEVGGFIGKPSTAAPGGTLIPLAGYQKPDKPLTESQGKATAFAARMDRADKIMNGLASDGTENTSMIKSALEGVPLIGGALGSIGNYAATGKQQQLEQSQRDFTNAILRQESGAAISPTEFESAGKQYFPQRGDSAEVLKQKAENRRTAIQGMAIQAGPGADKVGVSTSGASSSAQTEESAPGSYSITAPNGKTYNFPNAKALANFKLSAGIR